MEEKGSQVTFQNCTITEDNALEIIEEWDEYYCV